MVFPIKKLALGLSILDYPDSRKIHKHPVPLLGGVAFFIVFISVFVFSVRVNLMLFVWRDELIALMIASFLVALFGVWDDVRGSGALPKLSLQTLVAIILYEAGIRFESFNLPLVGKINLGMMSLIFTVLWFWLIMNAINLIDGLDGLASGVTFIATLTIIVVSSEWATLFAIFLGVAVMGICAGFLPHNFYPARVFMGDCGSQLLGLWLASLALLSSAKAPAFFTLLIPIIALGLPLFDTVFAFIRRVFTGRHPFRADKKHIHHRLLSLGYSHRRTVLLLYGISTYLGITAYIVTLAPPRLRFLTLVLLLLGIILVVELVRMRDNNKLSQNNSHL